jgi:hypothetical protein
MSMHIVRASEGRWVVARRPIPPDRLALVRDRELRDLIDELDDALAVLDASNSYTPQQVEYLAGVLNETLNYLRELRERRTQAR